MTIRPERPLGPTKQEMARGTNWSMDPRNPMNIGLVRDGAGFTTRPAVGIHQMGFGRGRECVWRYADEPGHWRWDSGPFLSPDEMRRLGVAPDEVAQRQVLHDRDLVSKHIASATSTEHPVETRGSYELRGNGSGLFSVWSDRGAQLTPGPVSERIAREVLALLAPELEKPRSTVAEALGA